MNKPWQTRWLRFDRMLTDSIWKQFTWITCILLFTWLLSYCFLSWSGTEWQMFCSQHDIKPWLLPLYLLIDTNALNNLYMTEGAHAVHGWMLIVSSVTYLIGLLIFNGIIISVLSNYIAQRKENYTYGVSRYPASGHYVIMGYDEMVPSIIDDIFRRDGSARVLMLSAVPSVKIRERLRKVVKRNYFDQIVVNYGHRNAEEYYPDLRLEYAKEIYIVGKRSLPDHDAVNVECAERVLDYMSRVKTDSLPQRITCVFEDFDTYLAFKISDIFGKAKKLQIHFVPYNYYVGWAKQVLKARRYYSTFDDTRYEYPALYKDGIGYNDNHYVHLVFVGTSTFAVVLAMEAAQLFHFPNGSRKDHPVRTRITFIDKNAKDEMLLFRTRYRYLFEVQSCTYRDLSNPFKKTEKVIPPTAFRQKGTDCDFLDVDFEFVNGDAYSNEVQEEISIWAKDKNQYMALFFAMSNQRDNFCLAMNMPDSVYDNDIPVFVRQDNADTFITELRKAHIIPPEDTDNKNKKESFYFYKDNKLERTERTQRHACIYPFGMYSKAFYSSDVDVQRAKLINYLYETADYNAKKFVDTNVLASVSSSQLLKEADTMWQKLPVALKWSNLYAAEIIPSKFVSGKALRTENPSISDEQITDIMARVEHNRWNMEKLLMGYRKPKKEEDKYSISNDEDSAKKLASNKKYHFAHHDIRPYDLLDNVKKMDVEFTRYIPWIINMAKDTK